MGPGDHKCEAGQARIATLKARDRHDHIIVQEKLDGTNVGVARWTVRSIRSFARATLLTPRLSSSTGALPKGCMRIRIVFSPC